MNLFLLFNFMHIITGDEVPVTSFSVVFRFVHGGNIDIQRVPIHGFVYQYLFKKEN